MIQKVDQDRSTFALGFQRAMEIKSPVAIIAGKLVQLDCIGLDLAIKQFAANC